jgi:hypothetical protein
MDVFVGLIFAVVISLVLTLIEALAPLINDMVGVSIREDA